MSQQVANPKLATHSSDDLPWWERAGELLGGLGEAFAGSLTRLFGSSNDRMVRNLGYIPLKEGDPPCKIVPGSVIDKINSFEPQMAALSDEELRGVTPKFRERLAKGETLESILPEAFAACRESGKRFKNMRHFDVQMVGGVVLHRGNIAEMVTGEGKTLVATLPAYLNALTGMGVHIVTVNDYLARRDCEWMTPIFQGLGVTAGFIQSEMDPVARRKSYDCDITYGTNSEFGFDYLRDNMKPAKWGDSRYDTRHQQCQKALNYAIIDEVDNILIDEARTPLIISGQAFGDPERFIKADRIARNLKKGTHFELKEKEHTCHLTEDGVHEAEKQAGVESFYTAGNMHWPHLIDQALKAHNLYIRDRHYMIAPDRDSGQPSIVIIDENTGRAMWGRQWSEGLHQAVEAKERVPIKEETQTMATVTLQNFFKLYKKLAGMTGTAMTEANEFWKIYKLEVVAIPTNKPMKRVNSPDQVYKSEKEKWNAILDEVVEVHKSNRPILVGTTDVEKSEHLSGLLKRKGIAHELLNAKPEFVAKESEIIAQAGRLGAVTISTNMAGRGTDIILGGNPEYMAWNQLRNEYPTRLDVPPDIWKQTVDAIEAKEKTKDEGQKIKEMGGLHVVGTERHEARRIDNQLRGRAGRQGDPGSSRFYVSMQDNLMRLFGGERVAQWLGRLGMEEGQCIESRMVTKQIQRAQKKVEERNFDIRKNLLEFDEVMDFQRKKIYSYRQALLEGTNVRLLILEMIEDAVRAQSKICLDDRYGTDTFAKYAGSKLNCEFESHEFVRALFEDASNNAKEKAIKLSQNAIQEALDENLDKEADQKEWNWEALTKFMESKFGVKTTLRELKGIPRDDLYFHLQPLAQKAIEEVDLKGKLIEQINTHEGEFILSDEFGSHQLAGWVAMKFGVQFDPKELHGKDFAAAEQLISAKIREVYTERDMVFPVQIGIARFLADSGDHFGGMRYDRAGYFQWLNERFPNCVGEVTEQDILNNSKEKVFQLSMEASKRFYPAEAFTSIDKKLDELFADGPRKLSEAEAGKLVDWASQYKLKVEAKEFVGQNEDQVKQILFSAFDDLYRPEMRAMERSLVLNLLDQAWKDHLYSMDHQRAAVSLVGYAQKDPKTEYKREGMRLFDSMWERLREEVTSLVFRMEENPEIVQDAMMASMRTEHRAAPRLTSEAQNTMTENNKQGDKKPEPVRNFGPKVGRNDPCHCGSGKKHKNCCMKK